MSDPDPKDSILKTLVKVVMGVIIGDFGSIHDSQINSGTSKE